MKIFAFILAFILLALSVMPCMDATEVNDSMAKTAISKPGDQHRHGDSDNCSPFCSCSCCSVLVTYQALSFYYLHKPVIQAKKYSAYKPSFYSEISFSIWQPPKVA